MARTEEHGSRGVLDPISRVSEVLFGLIMALTFTGAISAIESGREEIRTMLVGAIGCNIAWGLVDAVMYLVTQLTEKGRKLRAVMRVRESSDPGAARGIIEESLPPLVASSLPEGALESVRVRLTERTDLPLRVRLSKSDFVGAVAVFLLVVISTFPVVVPFLVTSRVELAIRISNGIAVLMMFACGYRLGRFAEHRPLLMGISMALVGCVLVAITIALGG